MYRKSLVAGILLWIALMIPASSMGATPVISDLTVTDVTPVSFSVVFVVSEPSALSFDVFASDCLTPAAGVDAAIMSYAGTGVSKATVTGLDAATTYCYQLTAISDSTSETATYPATPAVVSTETEVTRSYLSGSDLLPFGNDLVVHPVFNADGTPADGSMLLVAVNGGSNPVSASVGDGILSPESLVDLNNIFEASTRMSMNLIGGERIKLLEVRGSNGCTLERWRRVSQDNNLVEVKTPGACFDIADLDCNSAVNILDILRGIGGFNTAAGDLCFNSDMDMNGSDSVNILDILYMVGRFGTTE